LVKIRNSCETNFFTDINQINTILSIVCKLGGRTSRDQKMSRDIRQGAFRRCYRPFYRGCIFGRLTIRFVMLILSAFNVRRASAIDEFAHWKITDKDPSAMSFQGNYPEVTRYEGKSVECSNSYREIWHVPEKLEARLATSRRDLAAVRNSRLPRGYCVRKSEGQPFWNLIN